jgi:hypothetical protein
VGTSSSLDDEGNLVVRTSIASGTGFLRLLDAPWYQLRVEKSPTIIFAASAPDFLGRTDFLGAMENSITYLSPARAQELDLTFYGTGGKAKVCLSAGTEVLPYVAADVLYGLLEHERMPWPLEPGDLGEGAKWTRSFLEHLGKKGSVYVNPKAPFHNKVAQLGRWFVEQFEDWWAEARIKEALGALVPTKVELAYGMGSAAFNWLTYAKLGWDKAEYVVLAVSEDMSLRVEPASAQVVPRGTAQFRVTAQDPSGRPLTVGPVKWSITGGGTISDDGMFVAAAGAKGDFTVSAALENPFSASLPYGATAQVTVEVDASTGILSGMVYDDSSPPRGAAGVPLILQGETPGRLTQVRITTGPDGSFYAAGLPPAEYRIYLDDHGDRAGLPPGAPTPEKEVGWVIDHYWDYEENPEWSPAPSQWTVRTGRETRAEIHVVPAPGRISVQVLSTDCEPLSGIEVMIYGHAVMRDSEFMGNYVRWRRTDSDGRVTVLNMPLGRYEISCPVINMWDLDDSEWVPRVVEKRLSRSALSLDVIIVLEPSR